MPNFKPLILARELQPDPDGRRLFEVDPDICWPATLERIQEMRLSNALPIELYQDYSPPEIDPRAVARDYQARAKATPTLAWELAPLPRDDERFIGPAEKALGWKVLRTQALELVRLWFTQALHVAIDGAPMRIFILKRPAWRD